LSDPPQGRLRICATISPSESPEKVLAAIINILGDCERNVEQGEALVSVTVDDSKCLQTIHDQLRDRGVRSAARRLLRLGSQGNKVTFLVNKQAAYAGVVALCGSEEESPMGPIRVELTSDQPDALVDWLTMIQPDR
jgi:predicted RNA binding protein with dsRBD fold (UPF0201 family)